MSKALAMTVSLREHLPMWVIYYDPSDYPGLWVARLHVSLPEPMATNVVLTASSLDAIREQIPDDLMPFGRHSADDPKIVEVWL